MSAPRPIAAGAHLRAVAPAGTFDPEAFERGVARLRRRYRVSHAEHITARQAYLAGDDERRLAELTEAIRDESVDCIVAVRGGYGATRLLDRLDPDIVRANPKPLVGFSDITALHALWARAGVGSIHGAMIAKLADCDEAHFLRWCEALEGRFEPPTTGLRSIAPGRAEGRLLGGNLAVLTALIGTGYEPDLTGAILFLEDVGEQPYRIDRMLTTWRQARLLEHVAGVALGSFEGAEPGPDGHGAAEVFEERLAGFGVPVIAGIRSGHIADNLPLPLGARVVLDADLGSLKW